MIQLQVAEVLWSELNFVLPHLSSTGDVPQSLPRFLLTTCGDPDSWIYSDQKCDGTNNCGDCSDELSPGGVWAQAGSGQGYGLSRNLYSSLCTVTESWDEHFHPDLNTPG